MKYYDKTWNFFTGCTKCSPGCEYCKSEFHSELLQTNPSSFAQKYKNGFKFAIHQEHLIPPRFYRSKRILVNSLSDTFHPSAPAELIAGQIVRMIEREDIVWIIRTKRSKRMSEIVKIYLNDALLYSPNIWLGVVVESVDYLSRIADLRDTPAAVKCVFLDPVLSEFNDIDLTGIDGLFVGPSIGDRKFLAYNRIERLKEAADKAHCALWLTDDKDLKLSEKFKKYRRLPNAQAQQRRGNDE